MNNLPDNSFDQLSKSYVKKTLKQYTEKPLQIGNSFLQISKASEKWVTISESRKGLVQQHRRNTISTILEYILYKKTLFLRDSEESSTEIDPTTQSKQYQTQHENFLEIKQDFQAHLEVIFKNYTKLISFNVDEENNTVTIKLNHDKTITLTLPSAKDNIHQLEIISISTNKHDLNNIQNNVSKYNFLMSYSQVVDLIYRNSKESIHFITTLKKLISFKKQLKLLVSFVNNEVSTQPHVEETKVLIKNYLRKCKKGDELVIDYDDFVSNNVVFKRKVVISKVTKIRTTMKIYGISKEDENFHHIEFSRTFTKINQDLDKITNEIYDLYIANL